MAHDGYKIPVGEGRSRAVLVRPTDRDVVQLAILSTYDNILESVDLGADLQGAVGTALSLAREDADRLLLAAIDAERADRVARLRAAHARNPHLNGAWEQAAVRRRRGRGVVA